MMSYDFAAVYLVCENGTMKDMALRYRSPDSGLESGPYTQ